MYHLENKKSGRHTYYSALTALIEEVPDLGVSKSKLDKYRWDENTQFRYENESYIVRFGIIKGVASVRLNAFFIAAHDAGLNPVLLAEEKAIEVGGIRVSYKKGYIIKGQKFKALTDALMYFF